MEGHYVTNYALIEKSKAGAPLVPKGSPFPFFSAIIAGCLVVLWFNSISLGFLIFGGILAFSCGRSR